MSAAPAGQAAKSAGTGQSAKNAGAGRALARVPQHLLAARWFAALLAGLVVTACMVLLYVAQPRGIQRLDLKVYDALLPLRQLEAPSPVPVIIDIDDESLAEYGQWPWPRYLLADLLRALTENGAAAVGVDILLAEPDRASPGLAAEHLHRDRGVSIEYSGLPDELRDFDSLLAHTLTETPVVLAAYARYTAQESATLPAAPGLVKRSAPGAAPLESGLPKANGAIVPLPALLEAAPVGFINVSPDLDGIVRRVPLVSMINGNLYPSLALRTLMRALNTETLIAFLGPDGLAGLRAGAFTVPVAPDGSILVPFQGGRHTYDYVRAADVLRGALPPGALAGRVAFVGTSAPGLADIRATPLDRTFPGVEVHAAALDSLLNANVVVLPSWAPGMQLICIVLAGLVATLAFGFARPLVYIPAACALIAAAVIAARRAFEDGLFISPLYAVLTVLAVGALLLLLRFYQEERQKILLRGTFSRYVSPEVVKRITRHKGDLFGGEERELSILFTDIRGFTSISEKLSPRQIVLLLNRYFTPMTAIVRDRSGTLDKFIGDALMAFWNAPLDVDQHPAKAIDAALAMQERLALLNAELEPEFGLTLRMGAGVHTGGAYVGNMGSDDLVNYTLIGDNVNLASRLEGLCPVYGVPVVTGDETRRRCGDAFVFQFLDTIRVKGKDEPVPIFTPMRPEAAAPRSKELGDWEEARQHYEKGAFAEAEHAFTTLCGEYPDVHLYALYAERCAALRRTPPRNWDGIWTMTSK